MADYITSKQFPSLTEFQAWAAENGYEVPANLTPSGSFALDVQKNGVTVSYQIRIGTSTEKTGKPTLAPPLIDSQDIALLLAQVQEKIQQTMQDLNRTRIEAERTEMNATMQARVETLGKAANEMNQSSFWKDLSKHLKWLPAVMVVVGALLTATGVLAPLGMALMIGGACALLTQGIGLIMEKTGGEKWLTDKLEVAFKFVFEKMADLTEKLEGLGLSPTMAKIIAIGIAGVATLGISAGVGMVIAGGGFLLADSRDDIDNAAKIAAKISYGLIISLPAILSGYGVMKFAADLSSMVNFVNMLITSVAPQAINTTNSLVQAHHEKRKSDLNADAEDLRAQMELLEKQLNEHMQQLQDVLEAWQLAVQKSMQIMELQQNAVQRTLTV
jgi:hypothetical protein